MFFVCAASAIDIAPGHEPASACHSYRKFNAHRFLNKFHRGGEPLLSAFFHKHLPGSALAAADPLAVADVLTFLETCDAAGKEVTRALNDAYDMSRPDGAFFLRNAAKDANVVPDPENTLIPEHLRLKILTAWPEVFVAAYDRLGLAKTDNFSFYAGKSPVIVQDPVTHEDAAEIISASAFCAEDEPDPPQLIEGILYRGAKMIIAGPSKPEDVESHRPRHFRQPGRPVVWLRHPRRLGPLRQPRDRALQLPQAHPVHLRGPRLRFD